MRRPIPFSYAKSHGVRPPLSTAVTYALSSIKSLVALSLEIKDALLLPML